MRKFEATIARFCTGLDAEFNVKVKTGNVVDIINRTERVAVELRHAAKPSAWRATTCDVADAIVESDVAGFDPVVIFYGKCARVCASRGARFAALCLKKPRPRFFVFTPAKNFAGEEIDAIAKQMAHGQARLFEITADHEETE